MWAYARTSGITNFTVLQCGNINLCEPLNPFNALPGHMPWTVAVVDRGGHVVGSGLLVHPYAVLTGMQRKVQKAGVLLL